MIIGNETTLIIDNPEITQALIVVNSGKIFVGFGEEEAENTISVSGAIEISLPEGKLYGHAETEADITIKTKGAYKKPRPDGLKIQPIVKTPRTVFDAG